MSHAEDNLMNNKKNARPRCALARGSGLSEDRALQIINNVAEEYVDLGETNFATKAELCEAILWLRKSSDREFHRTRSTLDQIFMLCAKSLTRQDEQPKTAPNSKAQP